MSSDAEIEEARLTSLAPSVEAEVVAIVQEPHHVELKRRAARGVLSSSASQVATFGMRAVSMVILARLLTPHDFGLVGMVTAVTGFMVRFKDAGLSDAAVQSATVDQDQLSMLFWINVAVGTGLGLLCALGAHATAAFYSEPRLFWIMLAAGTSFVFTGLGTQHRAMLLRTMRIQMLSLIDVVSLLASIVISIVMAFAGLGYWALVAATIILPAANTLGVWLAAGWVPSRPKQHSRVRSLVVYGGTVTLNSVVVYFAYNIEKVLLGRFWGADALGIYGRAYTLVSLPTDSLHSTLGSVAFPALSRVQNDPARFRSYFLRMYGLFLSLSLPITIACALFAEDIVRVFLGAQWHDAVSPFRLLAPTILVFALINPFGWLLFASGRVARSLKIALMIAPVTIVAYALGLKHGPNGVAVGFSIAMTLLVVPVVLWSRRDTLITPGDAFKTLAQPAGSILAGSVLALLSMPLVSKVEWPLLRLTIESGILLGTYALVLLFAFGQKRVYVELLRQTGLWPSWLPQAAVPGN